MRPLALESGMQSACICAGFKVDSEAKVNQVGEVGRQAAARPRHDHAERHAEATRSCTAAPARQIRRQEVGSKLDSREEVIWVLRSLDSRVQGPGSRVYRVDVVWVKMQSSLVPEKAHKHSRLRLKLTCL
eukprot:1204796-Rhodomonas_salina.1